MDVAFVIRQRLAALGREQRDLARATEVTESYISQLLTRKKAPPAPHRTDIYDKMDDFLQFPPGELARLADLQRREELQEKLGEPPAPLFQDMHALILRKCPPDKAPDLRAIFAKQPFGELERLVTHKLLDVVKNVAKEELGSQTWLRSMARLSGRSYEQMRVIVLEFLDAERIRPSAAMQRRRKSRFSSGCGSRASGRRPSIIIESCKTSETRCIFARRSRRTGALSIPALPCRAHRHRVCHS